MPVVVNSSIEIPDWELWVTTSKSGGPGGQHANKTNSRVTLHWVPAQSSCLTPQQKELVARRLQSRLTSAGELQISVEDHRSQQRNREIAEERLADVVNRSLQSRKRRKKTRPTRGSIERRIKAKKTRGERKRARQKDWTKEG